MYAANSVLLVDAALTLFIVTPPRVYDWVIILGGTKYITLPILPCLFDLTKANFATSDIGMGVPIEKTFEALKKIWDSALVKGTKVLALTIPETRTRIAARDKLNSMILSHKAKNL